MPTRSRFALLSLALVLAACAQPATSNAPTSAPRATLAPPAAAQIDLSGIKTYLTGKTSALKTATAALQTLSDHYYQLAHDTHFDYNLLLTHHKPAIITTIADARAAWTTASPLYEQMEGIVAGTPSLAHFDIDIDAGASGTEDPANAVNFDLHLPNGTTLPKPGNLFGITESTLWGTDAAYRIPNMQIDIDGDGKTSLGDTLPDANILKSSVDELVAQTANLHTAATAWTPTTTDAFTALVVMVPTMNEYFDSWKNSRFIAGDASTQRDFVAISRLADIQDILGSLQIIHQNLSPLIRTIDTNQDQHIAQSLADLKTFVADISQQEHNGRHFTPEEADLLGAEAQHRATAITGQISQIAAQLNITIDA